MPVPVPVPEAVTTVCKELESGRDTRENTKPGRRPIFPLQSPCCASVHEGDTKEKDAKDARKKGVAEKSGQKRIRTTE